MEIEKDYRYKFITDKVRTKFCKMCKENKLLTQYTKRTGIKSVASYCKKCMVKRTRSYRQPKVVQHSVIPVYSTPLKSITKNIHSRVEKKSIPVNHRWDKGFQCLNCGKIKFRLEYGERCDNK
jgi:hypothetical protein